MGPPQPPDDLKDRLRASYNAVSDQYNEWTKRHHPLRMRYLDLLYQHCPALLSSPCRVFELGVGSGEPVARTLLSRNPALTLVANDLSDAQLQTARATLAAHASRLTLVPGDMAGLALDEAVCAGGDDGHDAPLAVVAIFSLIHLPQAEQRAVLGRVASWLRPGGCLLANFAGGEPKPAEVMERWLSDDGWMFWSGLGTEATLAALDDVGLEVLVRGSEMENGSEFLWVVARKRA